MGKVDRLCLISAYFLDSPSAGEKLVLSEYKPVNSVVDQSLGCG